ncbi:MAG TPA: ATP-binding protein [Candidatus Sulfotelmatobacter sp.]|nr:ATP-binding protein [Candidatus Sulfotelmatobacter sp.]
MLKFQDISIKRKLTAIIMIASTVALLLVSAGFVTYELVTFRQTMAQDISTLAEIIGNQSSAALSFGDKDTAREILGALSAKKHIVAAALYDKDGHLMSVYPGNGQIGFMPRPTRNQAPHFQDDALVISHDIYTKGEFTGTVCLKSDLLEQHERFVRYAVMISTFMVVSWFATLILSSLLQRVISRPIFHLAETASSVTAGKDYSVRATKDGNDELGQLVDRFNEMIGQVQQRDAALQQAHDELEVRVSQRTEDLQKEIIGHQRTELALKQHFAWISLLNQITHAISERQDTDSVLHVVLRQLEDHMGLDLGAVGVFDARGGTLNVSALRVKNFLMADKLELREGSVLRLAETGFEPCEKGQTVYCRDTFKASMAFEEKLALAGWRSVVAVPLMVDEKLFGVLIAARLQADGFSSGDSEFLRMLSEQVALSAHQARLHKELESAYHDLRRSQATILQQERLKALGQMASGIAHDVNNALSPVVGFSDLILRGGFGLNEKGEKYLQYIRTAGGDIAHIVARLREFYRTRDDEEPLQQVSLNALAEQVVDMTRPRWRDMPQSNGITIEVQTEFMADAPPLLGIESEIREALTNLVLNAVDAMPDGGRIGLRTRVDHDRKNLKHPKHVVVAICDSGIGMSEETRKRCLEPFFSTKGKRGTGLGLAMVYGVMERHEGSIEIESAPGKGTTFFLRFPVRKKPSSADAEDASDAEVKPLSILCIDDEPLMRELLKEMLERDGHQVELSDGGHSGLDEFRLANERQQPFDVVITDLGMPYLDGKQVAKAIKLESPGTPVVMLTGWGAFMKEDGDAPAQVDSILSKPPRFKELREVLSRF